MSHKADKSFFESKRPWSKRKDHILGYYLEPYLAKVAKIGRPILIVDGFAGPGKFGDGELGSPLIICAKVQGQLSRFSKIDVLCFEAEPELVGVLEENLSKFPFASCKQGTFLQNLFSVDEKAGTHTVFLYLDPFTVEGLEWAALDHIFGKITNAGMSVELLLNLNTPSFIRRALGALEIQVPVPDPSAEDTEEMDLPFSEAPSIRRLDSVVGGEWWQHLITPNGSFRHQVDLVAQGVCERLRERFSFVGSLAIKHLERHTVPKYHLVFATNHRDGFSLMNDAMVKTRKNSVFSMDLFAVDDLRKLIIERAGDWIKRGELILGVISSAFATYTWAEIRGIVEEMLKTRALISETGKSRINDDVRIRRALSGA
ncbi:hypothetical protein B7486_09175 [cyanobacterium TDX16]|nr:hypothetical protein B7486_09175 [cyanobacterium TDX16]